VDRGRDRPDHTARACQQVNPDDPIILRHQGDGRRRPVAPVPRRRLTSVRRLRTDLTNVSIPGAASPDEHVEVQAVDDLGNVGPSDSQTVQDFIELRDRARRASHD